MKLVGPAPSAAADAINKGYLETLLAGLSSGPAGGLLPTAVKTTDYTAAPGELVLCDPTAAAFTVTLPAGAKVGAAIGVKRTDSSDHVVVVGAASGLIDGDATVRLAAPRVAVRFVADTTGWRVESTALFDSAAAPPAPTATSKATAAGVVLGAQPGGQTGFTFYTVPAIARRGIASLLQVTASDPAGTFDLEVRGAPNPAGTLWLQAVGITGGTYRNPAPWYVENDTTGQDDLYVGIRNTGADPRTYTLAGLRVERFA